MARVIRVAAVSFAPPLHNHQKDGVNIEAIAAVARQVAREKPDFICFPEICACSGGAVAKGAAAAPELAPFVVEVSKLAKELKVNLVIPFLEQWAGRVYNTVPIVDRTGKLALVYRKNFPTTGEMEGGVSPGWEVPVAECDGVRVGAAVCFDLNYSEVAEQLEKGRARLVFWPSMFWGGRLLEAWALRYGFYIAAAFGHESAIVDMSGRHLVRQGLDTYQVRGKRAPPWAIAEINVDRELYHLDFNQDKFVAMREKYGPEIEIEVHQPEAFFLLACRRAGLSVEDLAKEFQLETLREYLSRSVKMREEHLLGHPESTSHLPRRGLPRQS